MPAPIFRSAEDGLDAAAATEATEFLKELRGVTPNTQPGDPFKPGEKILVNKPRKVRDTSISPVTEYVRSLDGDYKTTQEVANELGVSAQLVRKWSRLRVTQAPSYIAPFGKIKIHLYTPEDIQSLRDYMSDRKQVFKRDDYPE